MSTTSDTQPAPDRHTSASQPAQPASRAALSRQPGYPAYLAAATLGRLADEMRPIATVLLILDRTDQPALAGLTVAAGSLPSVLTGPLLGAWLDRTTRRRAALAANQVLAAASLLGLLLTAGRAPGWAPLLLALLGGLGAPMLTGGLTSIVPLLVPARLLPRANAWEAASFNTAAVLGPGIAALTVGWLGPGAAVGIAAVTAAAALPAILRLPSLAPPPLDHAGHPSLTAALRAGLTHLVRTPVLRGVTATTTLGLGAQGLLAIALPLLAEQLGATPAGAGYVLAAQEVGAIAGAFAIARLGARWPAQQVVLGGTAALGVVTLGWALAPSFPILLALGALAGVAAGPAFAATFTVRQQWSPQRLRAQVFTTAASLKVGAYAIGAALASTASAQAGARGAIAVTGVIELLAVVAGIGLTANRVSSRP